MKNKRITIKSYLLFLWTFIFLGITILLWNNDVPDNWDRIIFLLIIIQIPLQLILGRNKIAGIWDFKIWIIVFLYIFMLGRQILSGGFGITEMSNEKIYRTGYSDDILWHSSLFVLIFIHIFYLGLFSKNVEKPLINKITITSHTSHAMFVTGIILLIISGICTLIHDIQNIITAQLTGNYLSVAVARVGIIDDIALLVVPSVLYIMFCGVLNAKKTRALVIIIVIYYLIVMILTGDRRYPAVSILVLSLAYFQIYSPKQKFRFRYILIIYAGIVLLNIFTIIRKTRVGHLENMDMFLQENYLEIFFSIDTISETLFEFGISFFTVCLGFIYFPEVFPFRYGATFLTSALNILPLGFLYSGSIYNYGMIGDLTTSTFGTHVGCSMIEDLYANFGWLSLGIAFLFARLLAKLFSLSSERTRMQMIIYFTLFYALIHLCRASFTEVTRTAVWGVAIPLLIYKVIKNRYTETKDITQ